MFNTVVDGTCLQQVGLGWQATGYSQTFSLNAGRHVFSFGSPDSYLSATAYLVGPLQ